MLYYLGHTFVPRPVQLLGGSLLLLFHLPHQFLSNFVIFHWQLMSRNKITPSFNLCNMDSGIPLMDKMETHDVIAAACVYEHSPSYEVNCLLNCMSFTTLCCFLYQCFTLWVTAGACQGQLVVQQVSS